MLKYIYLPLSSDNYKFIGKVNIFLLDYGFEFELFVSARNQGFDNASLRGDTFVTHVRFDIIFTLTSDSNNK